MAKPKSIILCPGCKQGKEHYAQGRCQPCSEARRREIRNELRRCATCNVPADRMVAGDCLRCYHKAYRARRKVV